MSPKDWARLVRLPNLPTPLADIGLGLSASLALGQRVTPVAVLLVAAGSVCLYAAGMVLNDWCDHREDALTRPERPIPSGVIQAPTALLAGLALLVLGVLFPGLTALVSDIRPNPGAIATCLAGLILVYDAWAKHTPLGPLAMGACRGMNVLLGASAGGFSLPADFSVLLLPAAAATLYIAGVTWFARTEEKTSNPLHLRAATLVIGTGLALAACTPFFIPAGFEKPAGLLLSVGLMGLLLWMLLPKLLRANRERTPRSVQSAVGWMIALYIPLQASQATGLVGPWGLLILPLFGLVLLLRRWRWLKAT